MKLQGRGFGTNGRAELRGTVIACSDDGEPLGFEHTGNFSDFKERARFVTALVESTGADPDKGHASLALLMRDIRMATDENAESGDQKPDKPQLAAKLPGLVDIVRNGDKLLFLRVAGERLETQEQYVDPEGVVHVPPTADQLPWAISDVRDVFKAFESDDSDLFADLLDYHDGLSELPSYQHVAFIALWVLHTYVHEQFVYSPCAGFSAVQERGKSRTGRGMTYIAYRGIVTETVQEANLFRWSHNLGCTLFFDVRDLWRKAERKGSEDILLNRYERGAKAARVLWPDRGPFLDTAYFDIYGPTIFAVNETPPEPYLSRCVVITMPEADRKFPDNVTRDVGCGLRPRLLAWRARKMIQGINQSPKPLRGRFGDIIQPLVSIASDLGRDVETEFDSVAKMLYTERLEEMANSREARLCLAINEALAEVDRAFVFVKDIASNYNEGLTEKQHRTEDTIGRGLRALGFKSEQRRVEGVKGREIEPDKIKLTALLEKYGLVPPDNQDR